MPDIMDFGLVSRERSYQKSCLKNIVKNIVKKYTEIMEDLYEFVNEFMMIKFVFSSKKQLFSKWKLHSANLGPLLGLGFRVWR